MCSLFSGWNLTVVAVFLFSVQFFACFVGFLKIEPWALLRATGNRQGRNEKWIFIPFHVTASGGVKGVAAHCTIDLKLHPLTNRMGWTHLLVVPTEVDTMEKHCPFQSPAVPRGTSRFWKPENVPTFIWPSWLSDWSTLKNRFSWDMFLGGLRKPW